MCALRQTKFESRANTEQLDMFDSLMVHIDLWAEDDRRFSQKTMMSARRLVFFPKHGRRARLSVPVMHVPHGLKL